MNQDLISRSKTIKKRLKIEGVSLDKKVMISMIYCRKNKKLYQSLKSDIIKFISTR